jgi:RNA polymerase sigma-70 factor (ECF subfamily)
MAAVATQRHLSESGQETRHTVDETALAAYATLARSAHPEFEIEIATFIDFLSIRFAEGTLPAPETAADLFLVCACLVGRPEAISKFHATYDSVIRRVLTHRRAEPADLADATQIVYERLLVRTDAREPLLSEYRGHGALRSWVATTAARAFLTMLRTEDRRRSHEGQDAGLVGLQLAEGDPELLYFKRLYKREIELAVARSLDALDDHPRALLELHLAEGLSIDQLGTMYRVNRATAARWLVSAREKLVTAVRADLQGQLRLSESEYDSIVALVRSELAVTVGLRLRESAKASTNRP